jgi:hypothetical protein
MKIKIIPNEREKKVREEKMEAKGNRNKISKSKIRYRIAIK